MTVAKLFSDAHEMYLTAQYLYAVPMDLHNNGVGHAVGDAAGIFTTVEDMANTICQKLNNGELKVITNDQIISSNGCNCS